MYFTLINDKLYESDISINEPEDILEDTDFINGDYITSKIETPIVYTTDAKSGDTLRDFLDSPLPLMSKRFVTYLQEAGVDNLQLFPAIVKSDIDDTVWNDYFSVNILGVISCADMDNSEYAEIMPGHYRFRELAIHADKTKDALLFRLQESSTTIIIHKSVGRYLVEQDPDETLVGWAVGEIIQ